MRLVISLCLLLALLATGIPYFMGQQVEQRWQALDAGATPAAAHAVQLQESQHQRGWWSSAHQAVLMLTALPGQFQLQQNLKHGIWPLWAPQIETRLTPDAAAAAHLAHWLDAVGTLHILTTVRANTQFDSELVWAAGNSDAPPRLTGQLQVDPLRTRSQGQFQLSQMQWPSKLALQQLGLDFKLAQQDEGLDGDWTFRVAQAHWQLPPLPSLSATDWQQQGQLQQRDRLLTVDWQLSGKQWQLSDLQGSVQVQLHSAQLDLGVLQKLLALLQVPARQREYQLPLLFLQEGTRFLQQAPLLKLNQFKVSSNFGDFSLRLQAQASAAADGTAPNFFQLLQAANVTGEVSVAEPLWQRLLAIHLYASAQAPSEAAADELAAAQLAPIWAALQQQGYLRRVNDNWQASFTWTAGHWLINQRPWPPTSP